MTPPAGAARPELRHRAGCLDADPELFFPVGDSGPARVRPAEAKAVCGGCPVRPGCLDRALTTGQVDRVWGGLDPGEHRVLRRPSTR